MNEKEIKVSIEKMDDLPIFGMLRSILSDDDEKEIVKMMFFVVNPCCAKSK